MTDSEQVVQLLAHEVGHAVYTPRLVSPEGLTREEYVATNTEQSFLDEAHAVLHQTEIRAEILDSGGPDVGVSGARSADYIAIYEKYGDAIRDGLPGVVSVGDIVAQEIAEIFGTNESPSTAPSVDYEAYYSNAWGEAYDDATRSGFGDGILDAAESLLPEPLFF